MPAGDNEAVMLRRIFVLPVALGLTGATPPTPADPAIAGLFPDAKTAPQIQPGEVTVRYGVKKLPITLIPVRFEPRPERAETSHLWCGLALRESGSLKAGVVTIGTGYTELLSCHRLVAAGAIPSDPNKPRIGLIYETVARVDVDTPRQS